MYRLAVFFFIFLLWPSLSGAWGLLPYCVTRGPDGTHNHPKSCFIDSFVSSGRHPRLNLTVQDQKERSGAEGAALQADVSQAFQKAFDSWINSVRSVISKSGREEEFADFLSVFPASVQVQVQNALPQPPAAPQKPVKRRGKKQPAPAAPAAAAKVTGEIDVNVIVGWEYGYGSRTCADADALSNTIRWYTHVLMWIDPNNPQPFMRALNDCHTNRDMVLRHEIGHWLGLADLYFNRLEGKAREQVMVKDFSLLPVGVSSREMEANSTMGTPSENRPIGCDDVDALINATDVVLAKNGKTSPRWKDGWKSFCPQYGAFRYAYGQPYRNAQEYADNKKRIEAVLFFEKSFLPWYQEYDRLGSEIKTLSAKLDSAPKPLSAADLMDSAKLRYLEDRQKRVGEIYVHLESVANGTPLLEQYGKALELVSGAQSIAPGSALYEQTVLENYKPYERHLMEAVAQKKHHCVVCSQFIDPDDEVLVKAGSHSLFAHRGCLKDGRLWVKPSQVAAYAQKYGYDREQTSAPALTYSQLRSKAVAEGVRVDVPALALSAPSPSSSYFEGNSAPSAMGASLAPAGGKASSAEDKPAASSRAPKKVASATDQFSETALAGRPRAQVKPLPAPSASPVTETPAPAKNKELVCSVCGKKIENEADAYIPPEKSRGPVHKHSECAFKYFARFYSVDNTSLERYGKYYFLNEPSGVTAAKGLMKKLGLTPEEVKTYASSSREAARATAQRQRESLERSKKWDELKAAYDEACSAAYVKVSQTDKEKYVYDNRVALNSIRRKQKENQQLTKKERLVWQNYQNLLANAEKQKKCEEASAAWKAFNAK